MQITISLTFTLPASDPLDMEHLEHAIIIAGRQAMASALNQTVQQYAGCHLTCPRCETALRSAGIKRRVLLTQFDRVELPLTRRCCMAPVCRHR